MRGYNNKLKVKIKNENIKGFISALTMDNSYGLKKYIYERKKYTKRSVATLRGEKNTLMFYVLGQRHCSLLWRRHCINTPEQFYKVVLRNNNIQWQQR